jgi:sporulation protein YlmC with PRC-barrel domain
MDLHRSLLCCATLALCAAVAAQNVPPEPTTPSRAGAAAAEGSDDLVTSDALLGSPVQSQTGETLGTVDDVFVDGTSGRLLSVVLSPSTSVRADGQLIALPAEAVDFAPGPKVVGDDVAVQTAGPRALRLNGISDEQLASAPAFSRERWPDRADSSWLPRMRAHFGSTNSTADAGAQPERLTALVGRNVQDDQQAEVGRVAGMAVDLREREVSMALVDTASDLGPDGRQMAVPYAALRNVPAVAAEPGQPSARQAYALGLSRERLASAPRVDRGDLPRLRALARSGEANDFYGVQARRRAQAEQQPDRARPERERPERDRPERPRGSQGGSRGGGGPRGP